MSIVRLVPRRPVKARSWTTLGLLDGTIDLLPAIDGLRSLRSDLEAYYWALPADGLQDLRRYQVSYWIRQLSDRSAALESIVMHKGSSHLRLCDVSAAESETLRQAVGILERGVQEEDAFDDVLQIVAAALAAADRVGLRAAGGNPTARARL